METQPAQKSSIFKNPLTYILILILGIAIIGVGLIFQTVVNQPQTQGADYVENLPKEKATVGVLLEIAGLYPNFPYDTTSLAINNNIFEGLTVLRNGRVQPAIAVSWTNPDDLTWEIKLRKNIKFHNGEALEASDIKYSIEEAQKKENASWVSNFIAARVKSVEVLDESTVELKTASPDPTLLHWLVFLFIISEDQVKKDGIEKAVGTGPYKLVSVDKSKIEMEASSDYWAGTPKVKTLVYQAYKDNKELSDALKKGLIDIWYVTTGTFNEELKRAGNQVISSRRGDITLLGFDITSNKLAHANTAGNPFSDKNVRNAIYYALEPLKILSNTDRDGEALTQLAVPELLGYNKDLKRPEADLAKAKEYLEKSDYPEGFEVTLDIDSTVSNIGKEIQSQLKKINIQVIVNPYDDLGAYYDRLFGDSSMYFFQYLPDTLDSLDFLNSFTHTSTDSPIKGEYNFSSYSSKNADSLLDKASTNFDTEERADITSQAHVEVMEDLPYIPLHTTMGQYILDESIAFKPAPFGYIFGFEISGRKKVVTNK